jgi:hypothetical protein
MLAGVRMEYIRFTTALSRPALGPTQPPIQWVLGALIPGTEQLERPYNAEVKNMWSYTFTPPIRLHGLMLN